MPSRFDPPAPPPGTPLWQIGLLAVAALVVACARVEGASLFVLPAALLLRRSRLRASRRMGPPLQVPPDLAQTAAPQVFADGTAPCSGCDAVVPFESMAIGEDGYFCPGCARAG